MERKEIYLFNTKRMSIMKTVLQDIATAVMGLGTLIVALVLLPMLMPAGSAYILSIVLFIVVLNAGGYILSTSAS